MLDPRGGHWVGGKYVPSLQHAIGAAIEQHIATYTSQSILAAAAAETSAGSVPAPAPVIDGKRLAGKPCSKCGSPDGLVKKEGCEQCQDCLYSKCG